MNDDTTTEDIPQPYDLPYMAWTLLANVSEGDWTKQTPEWQGAVVRWRDEFHAWLADGIGGPIMMKNRQFISDEDLEGAADDANAGTSNGKQLAAGAGLALMAYALLNRKS